MRSALLSSFLVSALVIQAIGQLYNQKVFTSDIDNFWIAYDSCQATNDSLKQLFFVENIYVDRATEGLKAFMLSRDYNAGLWVSLIRRYPRFWKSIRPATLEVKAKEREIEQSIKKLKKLYPQLREARMYFTIGGLRSGGTIVNNMVLIGAEIATGNDATDVSEFSDGWLAGFFKRQHSGYLVPLNLHEYVHTQQKGEPGNLLSRAIGEGACDFVTELVIGAPLQNNYMIYGREHESELKQRFKIEMNSENFSNWLYNGSKASQVADLGYFMGYAICKSFYEHSHNKKKAIKQIIELNLSDIAEVNWFLKKSKYYTL